MSLGALAKIELKKCVMGKIKNTEGSVSIAIGIGLLGVRFQCGLYVFVHSSKWFIISVKIVSLLIWIMSSTTLAPIIANLL